MLGKDCNNLYVELTKIVKDLKKNNYYGIEPDDAIQEIQGLKNQFMGGILMLESKIETLEKGNVFGKKKVRRKTTTTRKRSTTKRKKTKKRR